MTEYEINSLKESFQLIKKIPQEILSELFFEHFFERYPALKTKFTITSKHEQSRKFIAMLTFIIEYHNGIGEMKKAFKAMEQNLEMKYCNFYQIKESFLWTMAEVLGKNWNTELENIWVIFYDN